MRVLAVEEGTHSLDGSMARLRVVDAKDLIVLAVEALGRAEVPEHKDSDRPAACDLDPVGDQSAIIDLRSTSRLRYLGYPGGGGP